MIQFGTDREAWCLPVGDGYDWAIKKVLHQQDRTFDLHNAPFDTCALDKQGLVNGADFINRCQDSYIASHLYDPRDQKDGGVGHKLKHLAVEYIDPSATDGEDELKRVFKEDLKVKKLAEGWRTIPTNHPAYVLYGGLDPIWAWRLNDKLTPMVAESGQSHLIDFEHEIQQITTRMILRGMPVDVPYTETLALDLSDEYDYWSFVALEQHDVENVNSNAQVADCLMSDGWEPEKFTPKSNEPKLDDDVLEDLARKGYGLAQAVLNAKRVAKRKSSYVDTILELRDGDDRIHPMIASLRARTCRMSASSPPFQQLPADDAQIRLCVVANPGWSIISSDYSQVEMRVLAAQAEEMTMIEKIRSGMKVHDIVATMMFGPGYTDKQYKLAKNTGFGEVFGGGAKTLAEQASTIDHVVTLEDAKEAKKIFSEGFPGIKQWSRKMMDQAKRNGFVTVTPTGRRLPIDEKRLYSVTNYRIQSSARDLFCQDLITMSEVGLEEYMMFPIHDEILAQAPKAEAKDVAYEIEQIMTGEYYGVPIEAEAEIYGDSWGMGYLKDAA
jgi:DNA polymerase-1